jgi:hypothetical protein
VKQIEIQIGLNKERKGREGDIRKERTRGR